MKNPDLLRFPEGKSCFGLKELTPEMRTEMADALACGYELYKKRGWI